MSYQLDWYIPKRIIYAQLNSDLTPSEAIEFNLAVTSWLHHGTPPVYVLAKVDVTATFPIKPSLLRKTFTYLEHPSFESLLLISSETLIDFWAQLTRHLTGVPIYLFHTPDQALVYLHQDKTLRWSTAQAHLLHPAAAATG